MEEDICSRSDLALNGAIYTKRAVVIPVAA